MLKKRSRKSVPIVGVKKGEVATARQEHKQQLIKQLAKNYLAFGESLGHYLHADIVGCAKELKK
jgi:hypothetical protein